MPLPEGGSTEESTYAAGPQFNPYDPEEAAPVDTVQPTPISPEPSSDPAGDTREQTESRPQGEQQTQDKPLPQFDQRFADPFVGLLYLGRLSKTFTKFGHKFVARTLTTEQMAAISLLVEPFTGVTGMANAENAVYQSAVVAATVQSVDGIELPHSLTMNEADDLRVRFDYVMRNWMPPVREKIYDEVLALELVARQALSALGEASG